MATWSGRRQWRWTEAERFDLWREAEREREKGWFLAEVAWWMGLCSLMNTGKLTGLVLDTLDWSSFGSSRMC